MKVVILAGGRGTRLGRIGEAVPKPMVPIGNRPLLWHVMSCFARHGLTDFVICLGYKGEMIRDYFASFHVRHRDFTISLKSGKIDYLQPEPDLDWKVTLVDTGLEALKGARVRRILPYLDDDTNLLTYGDGVSDVDLGQLVDFHRTHGKTLTLTGVRPISRFGELDLSGDQVLTFDEKPRNGHAFVNGGFMVFDRRIGDYIDEDEHCDLEIGPFQQMAARGEIMVYRHEGQWECMDSERDMLRLNDLYSSGKAFWLG